MKCKSGKHEWNNPVSAERCCDPAWRRILCVIGDHHILDPQGRSVVHGEGLVRGWIRTEDLDKPKEP